MLRRSSLMLPLSLFAALLMSGCTGAPDSGDPQTSGTQTTGTGGDGHDHSDHAGHGHGDTGPHDGHILETSDDHFHAEWTHSDDGKVTIYILDASAKADHPISAESVSIDTQIEGGEAKSYTLTAVGEQPATAFEITDAGLLAVLKVAGQEGATATLKFSAEGKDVTAEIQHADHGHKH